MLQVPTFGEETPKAIKYKGPPWLGNWSNNFLQKKGTHEVHVIYQNPFYRKDEKARGKKPHYILPLI